MPIDAPAFRHALARLPTGVTVLVARESDGGFIGMTASAVTSLSLEPPMILACIGHDAAAHAALTGGTAFGVNILAADQEETSRRFAGKEEQRFDGGNVRDAVHPQLDQVRAFRLRRADLLIQWHRA